MGSRLSPLALCLAALGVDAVGLHPLASVVVLVAVVGATAAAFVGVGDLVAGAGSWLCAVTSTAALVLLLAGSVARAAAPVGAHVPTLAVSTLVLAAIAYMLPLLIWLLAPVNRPPRSRRDASVPA